MFDSFPIAASAAALLAGYLVGSVPFGLILTRLAGLGDIRNVGSGNIGATNVLRTGKKGLALATLLLDGGKGALIVLVLRLFEGETTVISMAGGLGAILGHNFPVWLRFKGGKGVATTLGVIWASAPLVGFLACATWAVVALVFRISSLSALVALALAPIYAWFLGYPGHGLFFALLGFLGWLRHRANVRRLLKGEEPRINFKKS